MLTMLTLISAPDRMLTTPVADDGTQTSCGDLNIELLGKMNAVSGHVC